MSAVIRLREVVLGAGRAKIAASLCATTAAALLAEADALVAAGADVAEWRVDHLLAARAAPTAPQDLADILVGLRRQLGDIPLIVTVRSAAEGGEVTLTDTQYAAVVTATLDAAATGSRPDAVDVELARGSVVGDLVGRARRLGVAVVVSAHDVDGTPERAEMVTLLARMAAAGGDLVKLAVMAHHPGETLELLAATVEAADRLDQPVITMAMGPDGVVSRIAGEVFGSVLTFGALTHVSASGQVDVERLRDVVALVHESRDNRPGPNPSHPS